MRRLGGDLEADVMRLLWRTQHAASVRDVLESLLPERPVAYTTVMTVLDRLTKKGLLTRQSVGRGYVYTPVVSRVDYTATVMREALDASDEPDAVLFRFLGHMRPEELAALRLALDNVDQDDLP